MKPTDFRNATFSGLLADLPRLRAEVWQAWLRHGPCTTRELAARMGMDLLTVRPRSTELFQQGLIAVLANGAPTEAEVESVGKEGVYRARTMEEWETWASSHRPCAVSQMVML